RLVGVPPGQAPVAWTVGDGIEDLGREQQLVAHLPLLEPGPDDRLGDAAAVAVGGVEIVDAGVPGVVHQGEGRCLVLSLPEQLRRRADAAESPAAQPEDRDSHPGPPKEAVLHPFVEMVRLCVVAIIGCTRCPYSSRHAFAINRTSPAFRWRVAYCSG